MDPQNMMMDDFPGDIQQDKIVHQDFFNGRLGDLSVFMNINLHLITDFPDDFDDDDLD